MRLDRVPERVHAAGGFQGGGITRLLGTPRMDDLTLLVREAVQNSWDARWPSDSLGTVGFRVSLRTLTADQRAALVEMLDDGGIGGTPLSSVLGDPSIAVAEIADTGTCGLNGPTRADEVEDGRPRNFVDFIRNIGAPQDRDESGGTYGFGKGSYYRASQAATIAVLTRCRLESGELEARFIVAAVGDPTAGGAPTTGRTFWGKADLSGDLAEPLIGEEAEAAGALLGMSVAAGESGTSILVVGFDTGAAQTSSEEQAQARSLERAAEVISHQLVWQCWPKLVERDGTAPMVFAVEVEGVDQPIPKPDSVPSLKALVRCLKAARSSSDEIVEIRSQRPDKLLGRMSIQRFAAPEPGVGFGSERDAGFEVPTHHVALMRSPELVVRYLVGPPSDLSDHGWVGVFVADDGVDRSFAAAEPPSHDDWVKDQVGDKRQRRDVNVALREIAETVRLHVAPQRPQRGTQQVPIGNLASLLGAVFNMPGRGGSRAPLPGQPMPGREEVTGSEQKNSPGSGVDAGSAGGTNGDAAASVGGEGGNRRPRGLRQVEARLCVINDRSVHLITIDGSPLAEAATLHAEVGVAVDDGSLEAEPPAGEPRIEVVGWVLDGEFVASGSDLDVASSPKSVAVAVEHRPDVAPMVVVTASPSKV